MWRRVLKLGVPLVLACLLGIGAGGVLEFTCFQRGLWAASLCLLVVFWQSSVAGSEAYAALSWPPLAALLTGVFLAGIWVGFFAETTGWPAADRWLIDEEHVYFGGSPRFLSALICAFPAIPYAVAALVGLASKVGS